LLFFNSEEQVGVAEGEGLHDDPLGVRAPDLHPKRFFENNLLSHLPEVRAGLGKLLRPTLQSTKHYLT
jgi:hypothetical protein